MPRTLQRYKVATAERMLCMENEILFLSKQLQLSHKIIHSETCNTQWNSHNHVYSKNRSVYCWVSFSVQGFVRRLSVIQKFWIGLTWKPTNDRRPDFFFKLLWRAVFHVISPAREFVTDNRLAISPLVKINSVKKDQSCTSSLTWYKQTFLNCVPVGQNEENFGSEDFCYCLIDKILW